MRDFKGMKRQRSRNRNGGSGGGGGGGGGGGKPQHNANRAFDSNGPEGVKVRGAAQHVYEKYQQLARDAHTAGDRVLAENYLQHAEHYFRLMRAMQPQRPLSEIIGRDQFVSGYDIDFEDESGGQDSSDADGDNETADAQPTVGETPGERPARFESRREDYRQFEPRTGGEQPRADRYASDRTVGDRDRSYVSDRPREERQRDDRPREDRPREDRSVQRNNREDRPRFNREDRPHRGDRPERDPLGVIEPEATPLIEAVSPASAPAPTPAPTPAPAPEPAPPAMLRADDGDLSHAPAFLQVRPVTEGGEEVRRPRRRRAPAAFAGDQASAKTSSEPDQA